MAGGMGSSISEMDLRLTHEKAHHVFSTIKFTVPEDCENFVLKFEANEVCTGILLIPCRTYDKHGSTGDHTKAMGIIDKNGERTQWSAIVPVNFVSTINGDKEIRFSKEQTVGNSRETQFEIAAIFVGIKLDLLNISCETNGENVSIKTNKSEVHGCHIKSRFDWIAESIERHTAGQAKPSLPQFHPKQKATIDAIKRLQLNSHDIDLTYIGPDDTSNCLTALLEITNTVTEGHVKIRFRADEKYDLPTNQAFLNNWLTKLEVTRDLEEHASDFVKTDLIIETYTVMNWPKQDHEVKAYLKERIEALADGGSLVLVFPKNIENTERFDVEDNLPAFFCQSSVKIEKDIANDFEKQLDTSSQIFGNSVWIIITKPQSNTDSNVDDEATSPAEDSLMVEDFVQSSPELAKKIFPGISKSDEDKIFADDNRSGEQEDTYSKKVGGLPSVNESLDSNAKGKTAAKLADDFNPKQIPAPTQVSDWLSYTEAVRKKNKSDKPEFPEMTPIVENLRSHLENKVFLQGVENYVILQAHPGWGKTACLGASLFLLETEGSRISDKSIWVGTLQEVYDFVVHMDNPKEAIMIVDDFHNQRTINGEKLSVDEMHELALEISEKVGSLIITCQIDPMNGQVWNESPTIAASSACKVFENFMPEPSQYGDFIRGLLLKTDCIKPQRKERDGTILIQPDELQSVAIGTFSQHLREKLFSDNNIRYSGQYYSPRIAIRKLQQAKREFHNPKNKDKDIRSYEFYKEIFDNDKGGLGRLGGL